MRNEAFVLGALLALHCCGNSPALAQLVRQDLYVVDGWVNAFAESGGTLYIGGNFMQVGPATGGGGPIAPATGTALALPRGAG